MSEDSCLPMASYTAWLDRVFGCPVAPDRVAMPWSRCNDQKAPQLPSAICLDYLGRVFRQPSDLKAFSDEQVAQGLWALADMAAGGVLAVLTDPDLPGDRRLDVILSMAILFEDLFASRCVPLIGNRAESDAPEQPLNAICYMWWDLVTDVLPGKAGDADLLATACIEALAAILALESSACRESALHGLGHLASMLPARKPAIVAIIRQARTSAHPPFSPDLDAYAQAACAGAVL